MIDFLQKPTLDELQSANVLDYTGQAFVDTGIMNFALDAVETLIKASIVKSAVGSLDVERAASSLYEKIINVEAQLDLYQEITFAMLGKIDSFSSANQLREILFSVILLPYCDFFHIGKSREFLQNFHTITHASALYDFCNFTRSNVKEHPQLKDAFVYNTLVDTNSINLNAPVFIEGCHIDGKIELEGENILTGVPRNAADISLQKGICMTVVPIKKSVDQDSILAPKSWASIIYGIEDSFKYTFEDDECSFLNTNPSDWMKDIGISPTDLWEEDESHELWNARLFPVSDEATDAIRLSLAMQKATAVHKVTTPLPPFGRGTAERSEHAKSNARLRLSAFGLAQNEPRNPANPHSISQWKATPRLSLREILNAVDYDRLLGNYFEINQKTGLRNITSMLTPDNDLSSEEILSWCQDKEDYVTLTESIMSLIEGADNLLFQARLYKLLSNITRETNQKKMELGNNTGLDSEALEYKAFECVREAIGKGIHHDEISAQKIHIRSDEVVWVCAPARLDFAGGWSDTPPYCLEHGGSVLNTAVKLNGQYPIQVIGKLHTEPFIKINSIDLGERITISEMLKCSRVKTLPIGRPYPKRHLLSLVLFLNIPN